MLHSAFLFDYKAFRYQIAPTVQAVDQGDYASLYTQATRVVHSMQQEAWVLHNQGTMLEDIEPAQEITSSDIGYWLLILLSTYLQRAPSLGVNWGVLHKALPVVGWSDDEAWLLVRGLSTANLLKPEIGTVQAKSSLRESDPYWYWMFPISSYQHGWLSLEQISQLRSQLLAVRSSIMALDKTVIDASYGIGPDGPLDNVARLRVAYSDALSMLQSAEEAGLGLFMVIS